MRLENTFSVSAPLDDVWTALQDPATVAPCFPGAVLTEYDGGTSFGGDVKLKVGPITMNYKGTGSYLERDDATHTVVIDARGRDAKGQGTASAKVTGALKALSDNTTTVHMVAEIAITGRAAQFGRAVIVEVADRIVAQFAERLARTLSGTTSVPTVAASVNAASTDAVRETSPVSPAEDESLNLLAVAVLPTLRRALPAIGATLHFGLLTAILIAVRRNR